MQYSHKIYDTGREKVALNSFIRKKMHENIPKWGHNPSIHNVDKDLKMQKETKRHTT